jgi:anti-sigma factor RsiW
MIDSWTDRLSDYVDGELDPATHAALEAHLATCASCRATRDELQHVVARARIGTVSGHRPAGRDRDVDHRQRSAVVVVGSSRSWAASRPPP